MSLPRLFLESLEPRIAPAVIFAGPTSAGGQEYNSAGTPFKLASSATTSGGLLTGFTADNYYIALKAGDTLKMYSTQGYTNYITVTSGVVEAFLIDNNVQNPGVPTAGELTGLAVSAGAKLVVSDSVNGDIIDNLTAKNPAAYPSASNPWTISVDNLISNKQNIASLTVNNVSGSIIAGGGISNLSVGAVTDVSSGISSATTYTLGGSTGVGQGILTEFSSNPAQGSGFLPAAKLPGASLNNITVHSASELVAGGGGAGATGGSISSVTLISDSTGITIQAGDGGSGAGTVISGGAGGKISQVVMFGPSVADTTNNSKIEFAGGNGGSALSGSQGAGGNGGVVSNVWVGYYYPNTSNHSVLLPSENWLNDDVTVQGGDGGAGVTAGNGGGVTNTTLLTATPLLLADDVQVLGGNGGALFSNGIKAGAGGTVSTFHIQDLLDTASSAGSSTVRIAGGNASSTVNLSSLNCIGAVGGSVINPVSSTGALIGESFDITGGAGTAGTQTGGAGGSVSNLDFGSFADEFLENLAVTTGAGGYSTTGNGGAGGNLSGLFAPDTSLATFSLTIGDGGTSGSTILGAGGIGGKGGSITAVSVGADDILDANFATLTPTAGNGGNGFKGGGAGGSIQNFSFFIPSTNTSAQASFDATAGNGGSVLGAFGNGGAGGSLLGISLSAQVPDISTDGSYDNQFVTLTAGNGGKAAGAGIAGAGGSITKSNTQTVDDVNFYAGNGGNAGTTGRVGAGGSIGSSTTGLGVFADSAEGSIGYFAGTAGGAIGATVGAGAVGGSIINAVASAGGNMTFTAGNGSFGGNGGNITQIAFYGSAGNTTLPDGDISVIAGDVGNAISSSTASGTGGSVTNAAGYTSSNDGLDQTISNTATFQAGNGGAGGKGGAGGSFKGLTIYGGNVSFGVVAGNGGSGTTSGGLGGSVSNLAIQSNATSSLSGSSSDQTIIEPNVTLYAVAAGNGGSSTLAAKGAAGGSVTNVNVPGDIGVLTGENYGFATDGSAMGGIFAGLGGTGKSGSGLNGNVATVTAQAISAIVAGTGASPYLVNSVSGIYLSGNTVLTTDSNGNGSFTNFPTGTTTADAPASANIVGGKAGDPTVAGADDFQLSASTPIGGSSSLAPSGSGSYAWTLGTTDPVDGLIAALTMASTRNFTPLAFLTTDSTHSTGYGIYLAPVPEEVAT